MSNLQLSLKRFQFSEKVNILPSVLAYYNQKKEDWTKESLTNEQQLKTVHLINSLMTTPTFEWSSDVLYEVWDEFAKSSFNTPQDRIRVFGGVEHILNQGDNALKKIAWWYGAYPEVYEEKFALNKSALKLDKLHDLFKKYPVPYYSFISFSKGENPALSWKPELWQKVLATQNFKRPNDENAYNQWLTSSAGQKYTQEKSKYHLVLNHLLLQAHDYLGVEEKARKKQGR